MQTNIQNDWRKYFTTVNKYKKCNICGEICSRHYAPAHLYRRHNITDQEIIFQWNNDNDLIWQHFSKEDLFNAKCKLCGNLLKGAYVKGNLELHLTRIHDQEINAIREDIERTWVSPHFMFNDRYKIKCMYCDYFGNIYDGVDVLKNHLKEVHDLDEHFVKRIEKELDYLETTMQCTTAERNAATSFQDGNTHRY